jgi:hypothetical protein
MTLASFERHQRVVTEPVVTKPPNSVEHLVPREFASMNRSKFPELVGLLTGPAVHAAAMLTSDLIKTKKRSVYAHMQRHAPTHRLFPDALWTTGRILFMREGQSMPRHADKENMPGTDGADLMLTFGEVGGAELTMHLPDGEQVVVRGAETLLADFLNEHELGVMTGTGLRVAFVFWQQRTVVLSDHVTSLGAFVFPRTLPKFPIVHYFWFDLSGDESVTMRELNCLSMRSAAKHHSEVWLWCYQEFTNLPPGVKRMHANELLSVSEFKHAMKVGKTRYIEQGRADEVGRNVAQLSDLIRALALQKYGGWWLDADTVVLKKLPTTKPYYFATVAQKRTGGGYFDPANKVESNRGKWAGKNADFGEWDGCDSFQSTPIFISQPNTPLAGAWVKRLRSLVLSEGTLQWSDTIKTMEECIVELDLNEYVCPPNVFCPWPFWQRDHPIQTGKLLVESDVYGVRVPPLSEVLTSSITVQFFFMSVEKTLTSTRDDGWFRLNVMQMDCSARQVFEAIASLEGEAGGIQSVQTVTGSAGTTMQEALVANGSDGGSGDVQTGVAVVPGEVTVFEVTVESEARGDDSGGSDDEDDPPSEGQTVYIDDAQQTGVDTGGVAAGGNGAVDIIDKLRVKLTTLGLSVNEPASGIVVVPNFAQTVLGMQTPETFVANLDERIECRKRGDAIQDFELQFVDGDNEALHYRGNPISRRKIWLQDGDPNEGVRVYSYTGWQAPVSFATSDWNNDEELGGICKRMNDFLDGTDFAPSNHAIITAYDDNTCGIGFHYDKTHSLDPRGLISVVKLGAARCFEVRKRLPPPKADVADGERTKADHAKAQEAVEPFFSETLQAGTLVLMTTEANLATQHAVPAMPAPTELSGSIVFRSVSRVDKVEDLQRKRDAVLANRRKRLVEAESGAEADGMDVPMDEAGPSSEAPAPENGAGDDGMDVPMAEAGPSSEAPAPVPAPAPAPAPGVPIAGDDRMLQSGSSIDDAPMPEEAGPSSLVAPAPAPAPAIAPAALGMRSNALKFSYTLSLDKALTTLPSTRFL